MDRLEADLPGGAVRAFRDGRLILSGQVYPEPSAGAAPAIFFGEGSLSALGGERRTSAYVMPDSRTSVA